MLHVRLHHALMTALVVFALAVTALAGDSIVERVEPSNDHPDGRITHASVQIEEVQLDRITYYDFSDERTVVSRSIARENVVSWFVDPAGHQRTREFRRAHEAAARPDWGTAVQEFSKVVHNANAQLIELQVSYAKLCECAVRLGDAQATVAVGNGAEETLAGFDIAIRFGEQASRRAEMQRSLYKYDVLEALGNAYRGKRRTADAERVFRQLANEEPARGEFLLAMTLYNAGRYAQAHDRFAAAQMEAGNRNDIATANRAELYVGWSALQLGELDEARTVFARLTGEGGSNIPSVLGSAYLGLGRTLGRTGNYEEAWFALAKAASSSVFGNSLTATEHRDALGLCARAARELANEDPEQWRSRAEKLLGEFNRAYRNQALPDW